MKIRKEGKRRAVLLSLLCFVMVLVTGLASAAEMVTVDLYAAWEGAKYTFSGYQGYTYKKKVRFTRNGKEITRNAFCMQPQVTSPNTGWERRTAQKLSASNDVSKVMYFVAGAPGDDDLLDWLEGKSWGSGVSETSGATNSFYAFTHMILGYAYAGETAFTNFGACSDAAKRHVKSAYDWILSQNIINDPDFSVHVKGGTSKTVEARWTGKVFSTEETPLVLDGSGNQFFYLDVPSGYKLHRTHKLKSGTIRNYTYSENAQDVPIRNHDTFWFSIEKANAKKKTFSVDGEQNNVDAFVIKTSGLQDIGFYWSEQSSSATFNLEFEEPGSLQFYKNMGTKESAVPEKGAKFEIYNMYYSSYKAAADSGLGAATTATSNENGLVKSGDLVPGRYRITQVAGSPYYHYVDSFTMSVAEGKVTEKEIADALLDTPKDLRLRIVKKDLRTGEVIPQAGTCFELYDENAELYVYKTTGENEEEVAESRWTTDESGSVTLPGTIKLGKYRIHEVAAPEGYQLPEEDTEIYIGDGSKTVSISGDVVTAAAKDMPDVELKTTATEDSTGTHQGSLAEETSVITDCVAYKNLYAGKEYTIRGVLMDKATGEEITEDGEPVTAEETFVPKSSDGTVDLSFTVKTETLQGKTLVAFEECWRKDRPLAIHADLEDADQSVYYPEIGTTASAEGVPVLAPKKDLELVDEVAYRNLIAGETYTVKGMLMDAKTGEPLREEDKEVTAETTFVAEAESGTASVTFKFDAEALGVGNAVVAFEKLYLNDVEIASHEDLQDTEQTVYFPSLQTKAADVLTKDEVGTVGKKVQLKDSVVYHNLAPGREYTVTGTLMNKEIGEPLRDGKRIVTAKTTFTAAGPDGICEVIFVFNSEILKGKDAVVFETCSYNGEVVASHENLEAEEQTVHYPDIATQADIDGQKKVAAGGTKTIVDTVKYENLTVGKEYTMKGVLMNPANGKAWESGGKAITSEVTFRPKEASGEVKMKFRVDTKMLAGSTAVVFEDLEHNGVKVASHADINDKDQSVSVEPLPVDKSGKAGKNGAAGKATKTGDAVKYMALFLAMIAGGLGMFEVLLRRKLSK